MLAGARRLVAAVIKGGASHRSVILRRWERHQLPYQLDALLRASSSAAGHVNTTIADPPSPPTETELSTLRGTLRGGQRASIAGSAATGVHAPPTETSRKTLSELSTLRGVPRARIAGSAATGVRAPCPTSADATGPVSSTAADPTSPPTQASRRPLSLSEIFSGTTLRCGQRASITGSAATGVRAPYSTSADGAAPKKPSSRQEGPPPAEARRQSLSSIMGQTPGRGSASARAPSRSVPAPPKLPTPVPQPPPATKTGPQSAAIPLSGLFAGRPMPPPFSPACPKSNLPFLNEAAPNSEPLEPLPKASMNDSHPDSFNLEQLFDPVKFVKKYPFLAKVHPLFARDFEHDKWTFTEIAKELARSPVRTITEAHAQGISFEKFGVKDLVIAANLTNPDDISARILIMVPTKKATNESKIEDLQNCGADLKELMEISVGSSDFWSSLCEEIAAFLADLETPVDETERYLTVNHPCLFPLEVLSQAYLICFEFMFRGRLPDAVLQSILKELPYMDDEEWKKIARQHPLLERMLKEYRSYDGESEVLRAEYRRNSVSHKTKLGDDYPPSAVDIILQFFYPMFMICLLRALLRRKLLFPLKLHRLMRR